MQDMSGITTEPASSPPRTLVTDLSAEKSATEQAKVSNKTKDPPKKLQNEPALDEKCVVNKSNSIEGNNLVCRVCNKVLESHSALEEHYLEHKIDKSFSCKMCDLSFSTNAGLHRHMRSHKQNLQHDTDSEDSDGNMLTSSPRSQQKKRKLEHNNNDKTTNGCGGSSADDEQGPPAKKKPKTINNNFLNEVTTPLNLSCPVCTRKHFETLPSLETHIEQTHPDYQVKCSLCNLSFKNNRILNLHNIMVHRPDRKSLTSKKLSSSSIPGFKDCTFIDFSSEKFPQIAKEMCEKNVHKSVTDQKFRCEHCARDFPCESALDIHMKTCFPSISGERDYFSKTRRESSSAEEDARRDDFFANLNLQNKSPNYTPSIRPIAESTKLNIPSDYYPIPKDVRPQVDNNKDLADIQSILSVASTGGLFEQLTHKPRDILPRAQEHAVTKSGEENEEVQDVFAAEFRKMKLRGEFPCRLCTAIFPNLRALKGHNRVHLSGNGPGPYRCNMCPHSSLDKAALVRHMRTHNGDRPYECSVCNYAFTTKANCERHLRNRHSKVTREEVKRSIIYHPSEDPNNDEVNSKLNISREDIKRSSIIYTPPDTDRREEHTERSTPVSHFVREPTTKFNDHKIALPLQRDLPLIIPQPRTILPHCSLDNLRPNLPISPEELIKARLQQGKAFGQLTQIPEFNESDPEKEDESEEEVNPTDDTYPIKPANYSEIPMDLSTGEVQDDVLDLSKKKSIPDNAPETPNSDTENDNYGTKTAEFNNNHSAAANVFEKTQQILLAQQQLLKGVQLDPATSFYANQLSNLYRAGAPFPGLGIPPGFPLHPYHVLPPNLFLGSPSNPKELAEMKEKFHKDIIMGLQLSGGGLVGMDHNNIVNKVLATERLQAFHQQAMNNIANSESKCSTPIPVVKTEDEAKPLLQINTDTPTSTAYSNPMIPSPKIQKKDSNTNSSPNSVKMVIKNGVLMPKQKQRRYRTERPFSCEHCSARFTLRSNMERHIKQQHPQYWSQRQRSNIGIPRKSPISMVPQNVTVPSLSYESHLNYMKNINDATNSVSDEEKETGLPINKARSMISDQVKYAILAQQLKSQTSFAHEKKFAKSSSPQPADNEEEDEEDALVIDEEEDAEDVVKQKNSQEEEKDEINLMAKKVAQEILIGVASKNQNDIAKDLDWKIAGNLISKNPAGTMIPSFVSEIGQNESMDVDKPEDGKESKQEEGDLVPVSRLLDNAVTQIPFGKYFKTDYLPNQVQNNDIGQTNQGEGSEEDEEGLVASSGSTSEGNNSGSDENRSESETTTQVPQKKKSAYSLAPNRVLCPYCDRKFPWSSSLRRHVLTHTGQKPYKCPHCPLLFTTKSNCDRHLLRKHGSHAVPSQQNVNPIPEVSPTNMPIPGLGNQGLMMRNVPERPYKCASCPSSTFSTLSNLKKHMSSKHGINIPDSSPNSPKPEDQQLRPESRGQDPHLTSDDEKSYKYNESDNKDTSKSCTDSSEQKSEWDSQISSKYSPSFTQDTPSNMQNTDLPFKCHLCDHSYAERQEALDHIKDLHASEYELLMSKGALETSLGFTDELGSSTPGHRSEGGEDQGTEEGGEHQRGKFPDYTNRKVVCAFCMRRFWSAEDLRRHMRTHSGERPFSCDVCRRRFTLKHSMLRHRKKHAHASTSGEEMDLSTASGDEENNSTISHNYSSSSGATASPINSTYQSLPHSSTPMPTKNPLLTLSGYQMAINKNLSPDIPNNVNNNNSPPAQNYEGKMKVKNVNIEEYKRSRYSSDDNDAQDTEMESGNDLIGNLLGISDRGMINKLLSSADEAAKLLGVNK